MLRIKKLVSVCEAITVRRSPIRTAKSHFRSALLTISNQQIRYKGQVPHTCPLIILLRAAYNGCHASVKAVL